MDDSSSYPADDPNSSSCVRNDEDDIDLCHEMDWRMSLRCYYTVVLEDFKEITSMYLRLGEEYHSLSPFLPIGPEGPTGAVFILRALFKLHLPIFADSHNVFLQRLVTLTTAIPQYAAAGQEPDNRHEGKRRWLQELDKELFAMKDELTRTKFHLEGLLSNAQANLVDGWEEMDGDRKTWVAKIKELGLGSGLTPGYGGDPAGADAGDRMEDLASVLTQLGLCRRPDGDLINLPTLFAILKGQLIQITTQYLRLGVEYHNFDPSAPVGDGSDEAAIHFHGLRAYFTLGGHSPSAPDVSFLDRLATLHAAFPHFAAAGEEPDNEQGGKRRWLNARDEELDDLKDTLVAAEFHLRIMVSTTHTTGGDVTSLKKGFSMDKEMWEAKVKELDLAKWWIAETEEGAGDAMEE
ncbi:unnamed protein product [Zymoseptoria tritici ST99CH_1A5]|uniref:Uncharacterized protein n=2 Tax=Zymoseptoria tritici TaxID=1047171 RepID=F9X6A3_ZYMTI|nr:uncharacterized protein MYCGRDRAFT_91791 [Zymoseptoria tritici IPO323]EGP89355.1 hypothetical protein MYCGRDRAFT_91791 [Zymoseptoria tritici IPO323]SMR49937.1 unnamed protein product [Zymoseptoria tritici ST99CH_3D1]SMY22638.1 unnamed protein product [Zymoseptoria tritici ST99CH_1A5]